MNRIVSPCINVCEIDPETGWCRGCRRSLEEIATWTELTETQRLAVLADLPRRRAEPVPSP